MTAPLPQGLIRVVSATEQEEPSDPADVVYERKQVLYNFWRGKSMPWQNYHTGKLTELSSRRTKPDNT